MLCLIPIIESGLALIYAVVVMYTIQSGCFSPENKYSNV